MSKIFEWALYKKTYTSGWKAHNKVLGIISHYGNANQKQWNTTHPPVWLKLKRLTTPNVDKDLGQSELSYIVDMIARVQPICQNLWQFLIKLNIYLPNDPANPPKYYQR